jgi:hypothetical protein
MYRVARDRDEVSIAGLQLLTSRVQDPVRIRAVADKVCCAVGYLGILLNQAQARRALAWFFKNVDHR